MGLIPARAGNTNREDVVVVVHGAHPRSRGEHKLPRLVLSPLVGSSPLARGTLYSFQGVLNCGGLIPARAGNTAVRTCRVWLSRAHPRSRGEHFRRPAQRGSAGGSSPLARGTPRRLKPLCDTPGLIPARAGNTRSSCPCLSGFWAHPRSRGEHSPCFFDSCRITGSSPLARGTPPTNSLLPPYQGSSPLARGTPGKISGIIASIGLIPARAGNTGGELFAGGGGGAHPRSRGEHAGRASQTRAQWGSSPLARGTHRLQRTNPLMRGLIPARAGNTRQVQRSG